MSIFDELGDQKKFGKCLLVFKLTVQEIIAELVREEANYWVIRNVVEIQALPDPNRQGQFSVAGAPWSLMLAKDQECALYKDAVTSVFVLENEKMVQDYIKNFSGIDIPTVSPTPPPVGARPGPPPGSRPGTVLDLKGRPIK